MEGRELQYIFHEHPLLLQVEQPKNNGGNDHDQEVEINCNGCSISISGPFYSCRGCSYFLHKLCAELPSSLDHPLHPQHPLTLLERAPYQDGCYDCNFCKKDVSGLVYHCSECFFDLDIRCAFPTYEIKDKCHPHPLTPVQVSIALGCHICREEEKGLFYKCDICSFLVHQNCTIEHNDHDHPYPLIALQHLFHKHPLILKIKQSKVKGANDTPKAEIICDGCWTPISGPFYSCGECQYFLHKVCAELPSKLEHPLHPQHPLSLLERAPYQDGCYACDLCGEKGSKFVYHERSFDLDMICASATHKIKDKCHPHPLTPLQVPITFVCHICREKEEGLSYKCYSCSFWVHQKCILIADPVEHSHHEDPYPFVKLNHFFHDHPLILLANEHKTEYGINRSNMEIKCYGCRTQILGPFYSCGDCGYFLHKVCAELPYVLDHPLHPQHPLHFLEYRYSYKCSLCRKDQFGVTGYTCSICEFYVDMKCASATHVIHDKCHQHPLTPSQDPISFPCHICLVEEKSPSYRCNICPFGVHQNCTLIPNKVKHSYHDHRLKLFPSIPFEFSEVSEYCDICHSKLLMFQCTYACLGCLFFAHGSCARSETIQSPSTSRDQNHDGQSLIHLPMKQYSLDLISRFVKNYIDGDANIENKINHFGHEHQLILTDEIMNNKTCEGCGIPITPPSYGCVDCDFFLHKCCTDLPERITHPAHPNHQLDLLYAPFDFIVGTCCNQMFNSFLYECFECDNFRMDIKCASILQGTVVYHEAHKHPLSPIFKSASICKACNVKPGYILECNTCSFELCFKCAMAPRVIKHRYGKSEPFKLTYFPPPNHYDEYICELCLERLNPKEWFYHCVFADQFAHVYCMILSGADSNINYGKSMKFRDHEHELSTVSSTYDGSRCSWCSQLMRNGFAAGAGYECKICNFRRHLRCP